MNRIKTPLAPQALTVNKQLPVADQCRSKRRKLWDLPGSCHCLIIGTCLTLQDVKAMGRKCQYQVDGKSDYALHQFFVGQASEASSIIARQTQKLLDKQFRIDINQARRLSTVAELSTHWDTQVALGKVAGTLWAIATHPACRTALLEHLYGEVHMLSHLSGASVHRKAAQLPATRQELESLRQKLVSQRESAAQKSSAYQNTIKQLEAQNLKLRSEAAGVESSEKPVSRDASCGESANRRLNEANRLLREAKTQLHEAREQSETANRKLAEKQHEISKMEQLIDYLVSADTAAADVCDQSLSGKCVLLLGGMPSQCRHFKAFVESNDGDFLHHDGGMESSYSHIDQLVSRADAVICPIEKVSHSAMKRARKLCRKSEKPLLFLPKSSLSAFVTSLRTI